MSAHAVVITGATASGKSTALHDPHIAALLGLRFDGCGQMVSHGYLSLADVALHMADAAMIPALPGISMGELQPLYSREAATIAASIISAATRKHRSLNLCIERTFDSADDVVACFAPLSRSGYDVCLVVVVTDPTVAHNRAVVRYLTALDDGVGTVSPPASMAALDAQAAVVRRVLDGSVDGVPVPTWVVDGNGPAPVVVTAPTL